VPDPRTGKAVYLYGTCDKSALSGFRSARGAEHGACANKSAAGGPGGLLKGPYTVGYVTSGATEAWTKML